MSDQAIAEYIDRVAAEHDGDGTWYYELIIGFAACNRGDVAPIVYKKALSLVPAGDIEGRRLIWYRAREAILKATVVTGQAKMWGAEKALLPHVRPEDLPTDPGVRDWDLEKARERGTEWFKGSLGPAGAAVIPAGNLLAPELMQFVLGPLLGWALAEDKILDMVETERIILICLLCTDVVWWAEAHVQGLFRFGGTLEIARNTINRAVDIGRVLGITVNDMPNLEELKSGTEQPTPDKSAK